MTFPPSSVDYFTRHRASTPELMTSAIFYCMKLPRGCTQLLDALDVDGLVTRHRVYESGIWVHSYYFTGHTLAQIGDWHVYQSVRWHSEWYPTMQISNPTYKTLSNEIKWNYVPAHAHLVPRRYKCPKF